MKSADISPLFPTPFADAADSGTLTYPIPSGSRTNGRASLTKGFPKETMTPLAAGGKPPDGTDFNGILKMLSTSCQRYEAGYVTPWTLAFANAIGGYPKGAVVSYGGVDKLWLALADNNTATPGSNATQWQPVLADCIKTYAAVTTDHKIITMNVNAGGDPTGAYLQANDADGNAYRFPSQSWVQNYTAATYLPLTGGTLTGLIRGNAPDDSTGIIYYCNSIPTVGVQKFRFTTCILPFGGSEADEKGKVYLGYVDTYGSAQNAYRIQVNTLDSTPKARIWDFSHYGTLRTPSGNDALEIAGQTDASPRRMQVLNYNVVDGGWVPFTQSFSANTIVCNVSPFNTSGIHFASIYEINQGGVKIALYRLNNGSLVAETSPTTVSVIAVGPS